MVDSPTTGTTEEQTKPDSSEVFSTLNHLPLLDSLINNESYIPSIDTETTLPTFAFTSANESEDTDSVGPDTLTDWALREDPSHLYWVPAHLHPEIAPQQFSTWLDKHSSAVNHTETSLTRRKSILSLHSYGGSDFTEDSISDEKTVKKSGLISSVLRRQITVTTGMKIPKSQVQSRIVRASLKRSARTKIRRDSIKSTESQTSPTKTNLPNDKSTEYDASQTEENSSDRSSSPEGSSSLETTSQDSESEGLPKLSTDNPIAFGDDKIKEPFDDFMMIKHPPLRRDSLPILKPDASADIPAMIEKHEKTTERPITTNSRKKITSWSWFWGAEPSDSIKTAKLKKSGKNRPLSSEEVSQRIQDIEVGKKEEIVRKRATSTTFKKPVHSELKMPHTNKEPIPPSNDQKAKKSPIFTLFSKSKNKSNLSSTKGEDAAYKDNPTKTETSPTKSQHTNPSRFPLHIERGIYRLSHIKLTNPRRPLLQQVLISNMLFWYLSVISKQHFDPVITEEQSAREAMFVKSKVGNAGNGRRRVRRPPLHDSIGSSHGKRSEFVLKSPQYGKQHLRIYNGNIAMTPHTPQLASDIKRQEDRGSQDYDELPLNTVRGDVDN
ncbi:hypothetical protein K7432_001782 [Basidiobolus ranarum]|uniref:Protein Zds1 C-terminal domain-containing protein n=1 Tax=Basidiobolus ranarum TaxID=34480 RepID=A0ABR2X2I2_9FUNG